MLRKWLKLCLLSVLLHALWTRGSLRYCMAAYGHLTAYVGSAWYWIIAFAIGHRCWMVSGSFALRLLDGLSHMCPLWFLTLLTPNPPQYLLLSPLLIYHLWFDLENCFFHNFHCFWRIDLNIKMTYETLFFLRYWFRISATRWITVCNWANETRVQCRKLFYLNPLWLEVCAMIEVV